MKSVSGTWHCEAVTCSGSCVEVQSGLAEDNRSIVRVWAGLLASQHGFCSMESVNPYRTNVENRVSS